jgi:catechol 2,3-dioxygenase-like lactoylglutathione lyase family enzyme
MKRVTGLGGFFLKCKDPEASRAWYGRHLGIPFDPSYGGWSFEWRDAAQPERKGTTAFTFFPANTGYLGSGPAPFMCNFRVDDLDALLAALASEGVRIDPKREDTEYGKFAWIYDPDGQKIELWEPPADG